MKRIFSIGEAARITGISIQMLRNYAADGLVVPEEVNKNTGYRYYTLNQLHLLDKIKYLRELNIPFKSIRKVIHQNNNDELRCILEEQKRQTEKDLAKLNEIDNVLSWYIEMIDRQNVGVSHNFPYIQHYDKRYIIETPFDSEYGEEDAEISLYLIRHSSKGKNYTYRRQFGYRLDIEKFNNNIFSPVTEFMFVNSADVPAEKSLGKHLTYLPEGNYLYFWDTRKLEVHKNISDLTNSENRPVFVLEYSEGLGKYECSKMLEYQIYLG